VKRNAWWLRSTFAALALGAFPALAVAQAPKPKDVKEPAKEAPAPKDEYAKKFDELKQRYEQAGKDLEAKLQSAGSEEAQSKLIEEENPAKTFLPEFQALAKAAKGTETAAKSLVQVLMLAGQTEDEELVKSTAKTLLDEHVASPELAILVFMAQYALGEEEGTKAIETLRAKNTTKPVLAALAFSDAQRIEQEKGEDAPELRALYDRLAKEFKDQKMPWGEQTYGQLAEGWIFVRDNLVEGKVAPDFETVDENGVKWKLSDYKGKVVVIDFWGEW